MGALTAWGAAALLLERHGRLRKVGDDKWEAIIVAGCSVRSDGSPTPALARRVERAVGLWHRGVAPLLVLTGGIGKHRPAEAVTAGKLARGLGVPEEALLLEDASSSTDENARFARALLDSHNVLVVSDSYHVYRCERVFARHFDEVRGVGSISPPLSRITGSLREVAAVAWYAVTGRLEIA